MRIDLSRELRAVVVYTKRHGPDGVIDLGTHFPPRPFCVQRLADLVRRVLDGELG